MTKQPWWKGSRGEWYVIIQFVLIILVGFGPRRLPGFPSWESPWSTVSLILGLLLGLVGFGLIMAGLAHLGTNLSPLPHPNEGSTLVQDGVYGLIRHPIYAGIITGAFAWAFLWASSAILLYALILFIFFDLKTRREEKWLARKFPEYAAYRQQVRKLIPFVY